MYVLSIHGPTYYSLPDKNLALKGLYYGNIHCIFSRFDVWLFLCAVARFLNQNQEVRFPFSSIFRGPGNVLLFTDYSVAGMLLSPRGGRDEEVPSSARDGPHGSYQGERDNLVIARNAPPEAGDDVVPQQAGLHCQNGGPAHNHILSSWGPSLVARKSLDF